MIKVISTVYRKPGLSDGEFRHYWKDVHGPLGAKLVPGLKKYTQNHIIKSAGDGIDIDGFVELWFEDLPAYQRFLAWRASDEAKPLEHDTDQFLDKTKLVRYVVEEFDIV